MKYARSWLHVGNIRMSYREGIVHLAPPPEILVYAAEEGLGGGKADMDIDSVGVR